MLLIVVTGGAEPERRLRFHKPAVTIGRSKHNDIVLAGDKISRKHARIDLVDDRVTVTDLQTGLGTYVDGQRITTTELTARMRCSIGAFEIAAHVGTADPVELELVAAIVENRDQAGRLVYADWLESQGELERAEFLRLQESLVGVRPEEADFNERTARLRELGQRVDLAWRHEMARFCVEGCTACGRVECPREWSALGPTDRPDVRRCDACNESVFYCATVANARDRARRGQRVVVDIVPWREHDDLKRRPARRDLDLGVEWNPPPPQRYEDLIVPPQPQPPSQSPPRDPPSAADEDSIVPTGEFRRR